MDKVQFPYRHHSHLQLLHVIAESGSWEKYGLTVDYDRPISSHDAHELVTNGSIEFVGGNHITTYGHHARGDNWVYLGQTVNVIPGRKLVVHPDSGITSIADLREKRVGERGSHPRLNNWLQLKQHGLDTDRDEVAIVNIGGDDLLWEWVRDKKVDAAFLVPPMSIIAERAGMRVIDVEPVPMIYFTTVSTSTRFAQAHPDIVERFLKGMIEGIHFFKTQPEASMRIIQRYRGEGVMDDDVARGTYHTLAAAFEPNLYPSMAAIANVYQEGIRQDPDAVRVNPLEMWDLHFIRHLDDSGFTAGLYGKSAAPAGTRS